MTERMAQKLSLSRKILLCVAALFAMAVPVAAALMCGMQARAQGSAEDDHRQRIHFEVASIRQDTSDINDTFQTMDDGAVMTNTPVIELVSFGFGVPEARILGLPVWAKTDRYDMQAKVADADVARWKAPGADRRTAFQELLASRFALKAHSETREQQVLSLVVAKGGPKFHEAMPGDKYLNGYKNEDGSPSGSGIWAKPGQIIVQGVGIAKLVGLLEGGWVCRLDYPIQDRTGLTGVYDLTLRWTPAAKGTDDPNASLFTALEEQLGLKLKSRKGPVEVIVVDHVERPSPN